MTGSEEVVSDEVVSLEVVSDEVVSDEVVSVVVSVEVVSDVVVLDVVVSLDVVEVVDVVVLDVVVDDVVVVPGQPWLIVSTPSSLLPVYTSEAVGFVSVYGVTMCQLPLPLPIWAPVYGTPFIVKITAELEPPV